MSIIEKDKISTANLQKLFDECCRSLSECKTKREILTTIRGYFSFERIFPQQGHRGITGILTAKDSLLTNVEKTTETQIGESQGSKIVFKIGNGFSKDIEHEWLITSELKNSREFNPHFMSSFGVLRLPISKNFVSKPAEVNLFDNYKEYLPCKILFMEYVSNINLYHLCKYRADDVSLIGSMICMVLMSFAIGQKEHRLCHYDSHISNILMKSVEFDSVFLYRLRGQNYLFPTFGFYPVLIDFGNSYVEKTEGKPMYTTCSYYHKGLQSALYDNLNDMQHFLLGLLFYMDNKGYVWRWLRTHFMWQFRHIPLLSESGWKKLPHNIIENAREQMVDDYPLLNTLESWRLLGYDILEIINTLIILPWDRGAELKFDNSLEDAFEQIETISSLPCVGHSENLLWILRETVDLINENREKLIRDGHITQEWKDKWKDSIAFIISPKMTLPPSVKLDKLVFSLLKVSDTLSSMYYTEINDHVCLINEKYSKTDVKGPTDAIKIISRNCPIKFSLTNETVIYCWDIDAKRREIQNLRECKTIVDLNEGNIKQRANKLWNYLNE